MMKLSGKSGAKVGGCVEGDGDVRDVSRVVGGGRVGEMEIGWCGRWDGGVVGGSCLAGEGEKSFLLILGFYLFPCLC